MTGSGSAVFAAMPQEAALPEPPEAWQLRQCSNLAFHPLVGWAA
jgi:4-diphosphocytidyl-2-C-methyl-D-erythritol kinase